MKQGIWLTIVLILVLMLGVETGYLMRGRKETHDLEAKDMYRLPVAARAAAPTLPAASAFRYDPSRPAGNGADDWDPFQEIDNMQKMMNRMFQDSFNRGVMRSGSPAREMSFDPDIDIQDAGKEYLIKMDAPGIDKGKINVKVENNQLMISGEREAEHEEAPAGGNFYRAERSFGSFTRSVPLPADADADHMTAQSDKGVLTVHIPKLVSAVQSSKKIDVN